MINNTPRCNHEILIILFPLKCEVIMRDRNPFEREMLWCLDRFVDVWWGVMILAGGVWGVMFVWCMVAEAAKRLGL